ncbi:MAG TPA: YkgJ family cysteine cluster protein [Thermoanaerobaculia bacterium]|nr:YkgJ family cysteine cluster protein [Thermoanaerobaculia bacterium]
MGLSIFYNCVRCPAYCCSYPRIPVQPEDVLRLAQHFGLSPGSAARKFTKKGAVRGERILRQQPDDTYGSVCRFLDLDTRRCTVYDIRPGVCREYPGAARCGYYDFLSFERRIQEDPDFIPSTWNAPQD